MTRVTTHQMWRECGLKDVFAVEFFDGHIVLATPNTVHKGKLDHASENEYGAAQKPNLRYFDIADFGQRFSYKSKQSGQKSVDNQGELIGRSTKCAYPVQRRA